MTGNEDTTAKDSMIAIDELDVDGNVVYSTTVDKNLINNTDFYFVDVENCASQDLSEEENEVRDAIECGNVPESEEPNQPSKNVSRKRRRVATFSDHDCAVDEFVVRGES